MQRKAPKSPPKRSDYKAATDKFTIELGSPAPTPSNPDATSNVMSTCSESEDSVSLDSPAHPPTRSNPRPAASNATFTCSESEDSVPLKSAPNVSWSLHLQCTVLVICTCTVVESVFF